MLVFVNKTEAPPTPPTPPGPTPGGGYPIPNSIRLEGADEAQYLERVHSIGDTQEVSQYKKIFSWWHQRTRVNIGETIFSYYGNYGHYGEIYMPNNAFGELYLTAIIDYYQRWKFRTTPMFRDFSKPYHIWVSLDATRVDEDERFLLYVNGVQVTEFQEVQKPPYNYPIWMQTSPTYAIRETIGASSYGAGGGSPVNGFLSLIRVVDGRSGWDTGIDNFGYFDDYGIWQPKEYEEAWYGGKGSGLRFQDNTNLGHNDAYAGPSDDWDLINIDSSANQSKSTFTHTYAIFDYNNMGSIDDGYVVREGGVAFQENGSSAVACALTQFCPSGKWYVEMQYVEGTSYQPTYAIGLIQTGAVPDGFSVGTSAPWEEFPQSVGYRVDGAIYLNGVNYPYGDGTSNVSITNNDIVQIAFDADTNELWFGKNGTWLGGGNPSTGTSPTVTMPSGYQWMFVAGAWNETRWRLKNEETTYSRPTGFSALKSDSWPEPATITPFNGIGVDVYTGDDSTSRVRATGLDVDLSTKGLIWTKARNTSSNHVVTSVPRGFSKSLFTQSNAAETTRSGMHLAAGNGQYTIGGSSDVNASGVNYVSWLFNMIPTYGMTMIQYAGTGIAKTVAHNLGAAPEMIIVKNLSDAVNWTCGSDSLDETSPWNYTIDFGINEPRMSGASYWNNTAPSSTHFSVGTSSRTNGSGDQYIAYLFRTIPGFSKVGWYYNPGNPAYYPQTIPLDFRPKFFMAKAVTWTPGGGGGGKWVIVDSGRDPIFNQMKRALYANSTQSEYVVANADDGYFFLCNGLSLWENDADLRNQGRYLYLAFAEAPFKYANPR
jgi:hypothetical protein